MLPFLTKVQESLASKQLSPYLLFHHLLDRRQYCFRFEHSTQSALLRLINDVRLGADNQRGTVLVLLDFSQSFDTVSHSLLLDKLAPLGLSDGAVAWIQSYLIGRSQPVRGEQGLSSFLETNAGVH